MKQNELSAKEVAEILQISHLTVETHLYKAILKLEEVITEYLGYSPRKKQMERLMGIML